MHPDIITRR